MAKTNTTTTADASQSLTLDEFCIRLSEKDKRVALIGGFHASEKKARRLKDRESAYQARYDEFINKPA